MLKKFNGLLREFDKILILSNNVCKTHSTQLPIIILKNTGDVKPWHIFAGT